MRELDSVVSQLYQALLEKEIILDRTGGLNGTRSSQLADRRREIESFEKFAGMKARGKFDKKLVIGNFAANAKRILFDIAAIK